MKTSRPAAGAAALAVFAAASLAMLLAAAWSFASAERAADLQRYFTPEELQRAHAYRASRYPLVLASGASSLAALALVAAFAPALARALKRSRLPARAREPVAIAAVVAAAQIVPWAAGVPPALALRRIDRAAGLLHQGIAGWIGDQALGLAIGLVIAIPVGFVLLALVRRVRRWWIPAAAFASGLVIFGLFVTPVVIEPLFNRFTPLPEGEVRTRAVVLLERAGLAPGPMFVMDASRRGSWSNAYVTGLGRTQRVVLYDTLLEKFPPAEVGAVLAHEIGHRAHRHLIIGTAIAIPALFAGFAFAAAALSRFGYRGRTPVPPEFLASLALVFAVLATIAGPVSNAISRRIEADADAFALDLVDDPGDVLRAEVTLARGNLADPVPPGWVKLLYYDHPTLAERISAAEAAIERHR